MEQGTARVRVAYVIGELGTGGAEYQLYELARRLDRTRFRPRVLALSAGGYWADRLRDAGVEVTAFPSRGSMDAARLASLRRALAAFRCDVLHTVLWSGNVYGRLAAIGRRIPVVIAAERNVIRRPRWQVLLERALDRVTDAYLVNAAAVRDELVRHGGLPADKITIVHNGIDLDALPPFVPDRRTARAALGLDPARRLIAQVGRLEPQKDHATFLDAAARVAATHADVDFLVVGEGRLHDELVRRAGALGLDGRVRFTGVRHDVPALLAAADALALTSRWEGLPNVVIEAMATGAVPVATNVGGVRDLVTPDETGFIVPAGDPAAIAAALGAVLDDPDRAARMAIAGRRRVEADFTIPAMVRRTSAVYDALLERAGVSPARSD